MECLGAINSLRSSRRCAKKHLKSFEELPQIMSTINTIPVESASAMLLSDFDSSSIYQCKLCKKKFGAKEYLDSHIARAHQEPGDRKDDDKKPVDVLGDFKSDCDLSFVGEARFGVQIKSTDLERCNISAKTTSKLAFNLVEFIVPEDLVKSGVSVYGNSQYKLKGMPDNIVQALRGHIFSRLPVGQKEEEEKQWMDIVSRINNKLKNLRKGKYAKYDV